MLLPFDAFANFLEKVTSWALGSLKCFIVVLLLCFQSVVLNIIHSNYPFIILDLPLSSAHEMCALRNSKHANTSTYCVHTLNTKKISSDLNSLNTFTKETGSNKVKTSKSWIQCNSPCPYGGKAQQICFSFFPLVPLFFMKFLQSKNHTHPFMYNVIPKPMASFVEVSKLLDFEFLK